MNSVKGRILGELPVCFQLHLLALARSMGKFRLDFNPEVKK